MFEHLTVWHSTLVKACSDAPGGRILATILSAPLESKYQGRPAFVQFRAHGDPTVRKYQVESPEVRAALAAVTPNTEVYLRATGGRDQQSLEVIPASASTPPAQSAPPRAEAPVPAPQAGPKANGTRPAPAQRRERDTIAAEMWACLLEARRLVQRYKKEFGERPGDDELRLANALHIQFNKDGGRRPLSRRPATAADLRPDSDH